MDDPVATSQLLDGEFNAVYRYILWFLVAPLAWFLLSWIYRRTHNIEEPTWWEKLLGAGGEESPGFLSILNIDNTPALAPGTLGVADPPEPKPPARHSRVFELFQHYPAPWAIAGQRAVELSREQPPGEDSDIVVAVLRRDFEALWDYLIGWQPHYINPAKPDEPVPWEDAQPLGAPVTMVYTRPLAADIKALSVLLLDADGDEWFDHRRPRERRPLGEVFRYSHGGIPYIDPGIVEVLATKC